MGRSLLDGVDMAEQYLYLTTMGWKSGKPHKIEIWYVEHGDCYYLVSEMRERSHWVQNIRHNSTIQVRVGEHHFTGIGRVLDANMEPDLYKTISNLMDAKYNWSDGLIVELCPQE